jgi:Protein of unknown function (DUF1812).
MSYSSSFQKIILAIFHSCRFFPILIVLSFIFGSCILENLDDCAEYNLTVRIVDEKGEDLPKRTLNSLNAYLFDSTGFVREVSMLHDNNLFFGYNISDKLTVVAWGNLRVDSLLLPSLTPGVSLDSASIKLRKEGVYDLTSTDLFYTRYMRNHSNSLRSGSMPEDTITLTLSRKAAMVSIDAYHIGKHFSGDTTNLHFEVRGTLNALNFMGEPAGESAVYEPKASYTASGSFSTGMFRVLPVSDNGRIYVDIYRGEQLVYTASTDSKGEVLRAVSGMHLNVSITFDFATVLVTCAITPWGEEKQETTF